MDSVGAQPSPVPGGSGGNGHRKRFSSLVNSLRKSSNHNFRDSQLSFSSIGRIPSPGPPQLELSSSPRSPMLTPSFSPTFRSPSLEKAVQQQQYPVMQSGTRRTQEHLQPARSSDWPPSSSQIESRLGSGDWKTGEGSITPLVGLGLSESAVGGGRRSPVMTRQTPSYLVMQPRDQNINKLSSLEKSRVTESDNINSSSSKSSGKVGAVMGTGLPSAYTHGGNAPSASYVPRSGVLVDSLPSSMRFDREQGSPLLFSPTSRSWAFRREPYYAAGQNQSQSHPQPHQHTQTQASSIINYRSNNGGSASSSPMIGVSSSSVHPREESRASSSEDHAHSFANTYTGRTLAGGSTSTSMTSLRDGSYHVKGGGASSIDQRSMNKIPSTQSRLQHRKVDSKSTLNSFGSRPSTTEEAGEQEKGKGKFVSKSVGAPGSSIRTTQSSVSQEGLDSASSSPAVHVRNIQMPSTVEGRNTETIKEDGKDKTRSISIKPGELVPVRFTSTLSPIAASASGETGRMSQVERFETDFTSNVGVPSAVSIQPFSPRSEHILHEVQEKAVADQEPGVKNEDLSRSEEKKRELREESALRRFTLLQQLHLDEFVSHAPESGGWLEPKNGCERVLMPRPTLNHRRTTSSNDGLADGYQSEGGQALRRSTKAAGTTAAFERNRALPTGYQSHPDERDSSRMQALLDVDNLKILDRSNGANRPFFHHRMPPEIPSYDPLSSTAKSPRAAQWYLAEERPPIPVRSSSRRGHRHRHRSNVEIATPALTPNVLSDGEDDDLQRTPDLETVIAQGHALDEERERWREEYKRSIGAAESFRRKSRKNVQKQTSHNKKKGESQSIRQSKSSPDLRQKKPNQPPPPMPSPPLTASCLPRSWGLHADQESRLKAIRKRSKSLEGFSRFRASAIFAASSFATPCVNSSERRRNADDLVDGEKGEGDVYANRRKSKSSIRRKRALTASQYENEKARKSIASGDRIIIDRPYIIGKIMNERGTSPNLGAGPFAIRHPSWYVLRDIQDSNGVKQDLTSLKPIQNTDVIDQFAAAISSPRPDLGLQYPQTTSEDTFSTAGRYATKKGYHRPSNSDELAAILHLRSKGEIQNSPLSRQSHVETIPIVKSEIISRPAIADGTEEEKRRLSLGMNRVLGDGRGNKSDDTPFVRQRYDSEVIMKNKSAVSLPVPPRRPRSNSNAGASASSHSRTSMERSRQSSLLPERQEQDPAAEKDSALSPWSQLDPTKQRIAIPHSPFLNLQEGSYMQAGAFETPPLDLSSTTRDDNWLTNEDSQKASSSTTQAPTSSLIRPTVPTNEGRRFSSKASMANSILDEQNINAAIAHAQRSLSSLGRMSSEDTASQHSRELLWNTDEAGEEAFNSLFFRKPRPTGEIMSRDQSNLMTLDSDYTNTPMANTVEDEGNSSNETANQRLAIQDLFPASPRGMFEGKDEEEEDVEGDETRTTIAEESDSHAHAGDTTIERMIGNLTQLPDAPALINFARTSIERTTRVGRESALSDNESAWNDSSIGEYFAPHQGSINIAPMYASHSVQPPIIRSTHQPTSNIEQFIGMRLGRVDSVRQPQIRTADISIRREEKKPLKDSIDRPVGEVNVLGQDAETSTHDSSLRPRAQSLSASVIMSSSSNGEQENQAGLSASPPDIEPSQPIFNIVSPPLEDQQEHPKTYEDSGTIGFIDFASPAAPRPLSLPEEVDMTSVLRTTGGSNQLEAPSVWKQRPISGESSAGSFTGTLSPAITQGSSSPTGEGHGTHFDIRRGSGGIMNMVRSRVWPTPPVSPAAIQRTNRLSQQANPLNREGEIDNQKRD